MEEGEEKEAVVPKTWLTEKLLYWPKANSTKAFRDQEKPKKAWKSFEIVMIKMQSGSLLKRKKIAMVWYSLVIVLNLIPYLS